MNSLETHHGGASNQFEVACFDIDQTLKAGQGNGIAGVSPQNIRAVKDVRQRGLVSMAVTGRIFQQTTPFVRIARMNGPSVCSDGALVRLPRGKILTKSFMPKELVAAVRSHTKTLGVTTLSHLHEGVCVTTRNFWNHDMDRHRVELLDRLMYRTPAEVRRRETLKLLCSAQSAEIDDLEAWARTQFAVQDVTIIRNTPEILEFRPVGVTKASGLAVVAQYLGFAPSQFMCFGDGTNDVEMLRWAGLGVAMYHGSEAAKAAADLVVVSPSPDVDLAVAVDQVIKTHWNKGVSRWCPAQA